MFTPTITDPVPALASRLRELEAERAFTALEGITDAAYLADLRQEIAEARAAYVGAAVTEIATLRGQLDGHLVG